MYRIGDMERPHEGTGPLNDAVAAQIRAERARHRLTQAEAAKRAGLSRGVYIRIETGDRDIKVDQLAKVAPVFGLTVGALLTLAEEQRPDRYTQVARDAAATYRDPMFKAASQVADTQSGEPRPTQTDDDAGHRRGGSRHSKGA